MLPSGTASVRLQKCVVGVQEWKEHLERQLDSLLGQVVHGSLKVLRGNHNRLAGGAAFPLSLHRLPLCY